ncbi:MAG: pilin [Parcubacteria group bacterium]
MQNKKIFLVPILCAIIFANFAFFLPPASAQVSTPEPSWTGLVPCGRNTGTAAEMAPCTLCHLIIGFQRLVQYGMYMVATLALVGIFFAGVMYMVSTGDENMMTQAKGFLKVSLIGFSVVIGGWLIVNVTVWVLGAKADLGIGITSWNKFTCSTKSSAGTSTNGDNSYSGMLGDFFVSYPSLAFPVGEHKYEKNVSFYVPGENKDKYAYNCSIKPSNLKAEMTGATACTITGTPSAQEYILTFSATAKKGSGAPAVESQTVAIKASS